MNFAASVRAFSRQVEAKTDAVFIATGDATLGSIREGSAVTGAPGQPVAVDGSPNDGELRDSYTIQRQDNAHAAVTSTASYARDVEDNVHEFQFANHGPHSIKMTVANFGDLVADVVRTVE